eukprot:TRINITY_DN5050_c0_g1_i1.p2 TRINITY_DN5050_c0_g1~~TRINITY_DN5050_c0_g1_i1.p2  ORF type:complete len:284 (-),score=101.05 TRINITY_DN5050_c0_g1_i1:608-1459(-)
MTEDESKTVFVSNVSPNATEKTVSDFFSFCGKITKLYLKQDEGRNTKSAIVQFETESAAKTALLLSNALIVDLPIAVVPYSQAAVTAPLAPAAEPADITTRDFGVPDEQRSKTSVIVSLLAAGYVVGEDAIQKAKEFDEKHSILLQARIGFETVKAKALEVDQKLHISEKVAAAAHIVEDKAKQVDEKYQVSAKAHQAANVVKDKANETLAKLKENPKFVDGLAKASELADSVKAQVTSKYHDLSQQVSAAVAEKRAEKGEAAPGAAAAAVAEAPAEAAPLQQ